MRTPEKLALLLLLVSCPVVSEETEGFGESEPSPYSYGKRGLQYASADGNNFLWFGVRLQTRYSNARITQDLLPGEPISGESELKVNRGRLKLGGHLVSPRFTVYTEYDFVDDRLLDLRASYRFAHWFNIRIGQWKSEFNRERIDSSGNQQFAERSVATPWFTIDRQKGIALSGRIGEGQRWDTSYWVERLSGAGRGGSIDEADGLWLARLQWNIGGRLLGFSQSDIERHKEGAGSVAVALVSGRSKYTSFSSAGGGQLPGYVDGDADQYRIQQLLIETAWQKNGFSWQQEYHWKTVEDKSTEIKRRLSGGYVQAGMFFAEIWQSVPDPLELAVRFARVDPDHVFATDIDRESTLAANWFFNGHRNKLTADVSFFKRRLAPENDSGYRYRLQWEWSF